MLELLTKQNGIEVYRLSYKKILLKLSIPVLLKNSNTLLYKKEAKYRYRINDNDTYELIVTDRIMRGVNQKYGIKLKHVHESYNMNVKINNLIFNKVVSSIFISDITSERNILLNSLVDG